MLGVAACRPLEQAHRAPSFGLRDRDRDRPPSRQVGTQSAELPDGSLELLDRLDRRGPGGAVWHAVREDPSSSGEATIDRLIVVHAVP